MILNNLTIKKAHESLKNGEFTVLDLVNAYKKNIEEKNKDINAFIEVFEDVEEQAKIAQEKFTNGTATLMTGIPVAIKDNILIKDKIASSASKILENYRATYSATAIEKLQKEGAIFIGRTNMDEFAMGASTENSVYGVTKNPHDLTRVAGGTSGGSTAAVAMDGALVALGSDTGGSVRQPAGFCGVVGLKPTYGAVSRYGLMAMASSFDVIGPIGKTVEDTEIIFNSIKGIEPLDSTTVEGFDNSSVSKIGVPFSYLENGVDDDVKSNFIESINKLKDAGYEIVDIELPHIEYSIPVYYVLVPAEVSSNMARYDGVKYGSKVEGKDLTEDYFNTRGRLLGPEVRRRIIIGTFALSAGYADQYYYKAWQVRNLLKQDMKNAFEKVDVIALPTSPNPAFKIGERVDDPLKMYLADIFTSIANLTGVPAISIPSGFAKREEKDLPLAIEFFAPHLKENRLFEIGKKFEAIRDDGK